MRVGVLGSTRIERDDEIVEPPARKLRSLLAALALEPGALVSPDRLVDLVWGDDAPRGAHGTLHSYVSGLRRLLEPSLAARAKPTILITTDAGYRLALGRDAVDATVFADRVRALHRAAAALASQLGPGPQTTWPERTIVAADLEALEAALGTWRGTAYADLGEHPAALSARTGLEELRLTAEEDRALLMLALGDHAGVVAATEQATARNPFRERTWGLHALALVRSGRQADALAALRNVRETLADELGIDPGPELRALETAILRQDEAILASLPPAPVEVRQPAERAAPMPSPPPVRGSWAIVGRARERAALETMLAEAAAGTPAYTLLVGDPGTGKSRLADHIAGLATDRGFAVAVGRCSQDDGAPPLWPWAAVLDGLATSAGDAVDLSSLRERLRTDPMGDHSGDHAEQAFEVADHIARAARRRASSGPVLLVFDDTQWADSATLRALSHLVATSARGESLAVLVTRRTWPQPTGPYADLEVNLSRAGVVLTLAGLDRAESAALVTSMLSPTQVAGLEVAWHAATGGNAFFLVELARLTAENDGWHGEVPPSVQSVVRQRLGHLPRPTQDALVTAAALGREFSPVVLAAVLGLAPWSADELLDPARDAGIVRDRAAGVVAFEHALTRDAVSATVFPSQLARTHARIAYALEQPGAPITAELRHYELARHWLAAGPVHAPQAWRAAADAAARARADFAHDEAVGLLTAGLAAQRVDPTASPTERFDLLLLLAEVAAYAGKWPDVVAAAVEAIGLARAAGEPSRVARAAEELTRHNVWMPQDHQVVADDLIDDLRHALANLDQGAGPDRVRLALALACQLYYAPDRAGEIDALVAEGIATARRLGEPGLLRWAAHTASIALWRTRYAPQRAELIADALTAARVLGDLDAEALELATAAGIALELGRRADFERWMAEASGLARRRGLGYLRLALGTVHLNLAALRKDPGLEAVRAELLDVAREAVPLNGEVFDWGVVFMTALWNPALWEPGGDSSYLDSMLPGVRETGNPLMSDPLCIGLARAGRIDELRDLVGTIRIDPITDSWSASWDIAFRAEVATVLGDRDGAAVAATFLRQVSGRIAVGGISGVGGPTDGYLALAEATLGNRSAAAAAAERAAVQAAEWGMTAYLDWLAAWRAELGL